MVEQAPPLLRVESGWPLVIQTVYRKRAFLRYFELKGFDCRRGLKEWFGEHLEFLRCDLI